MKQHQITDNLKKVLLKKALGYDVKESAEEFSVDSGETLQKTKVKVTSKHCPPDLNALKILLDMGGETNEITDMTDEQLQKEKMRLINLLKQTGEEDAE